MVAQIPDVLIGDFNSGLDYQPEGYEHLLANGYVDLIQTQPVETWCPPSHVSAFLPCVIAGMLAHYSNKFYLFLLLFIFHGCPRLFLADFQVNTRPPLTTS
jgi:hypothetical protein